jgi:iron complex outermembrane receptor protein
MFTKFNKWKWKEGLSAAFLGAAIYLGSGIAATAYAADEATTDAQAATAAPIEEIVITGSRIPVPANINATSPIIAVSSQEIGLEGHTDTISVLSAMPQNIIGAAVDLGNNQNPLLGTAGVATADLRGLGPQRTLVLVDGKRLGIGDPDTTNPNPAPDLDQIPAALIERVDVVTGGASAVYGSDAVAGVINFVMKKNFEGVQVDGQYGFYDHNNGETGLQSLLAAKQTAIGATNPPFTAPNGNIRDGDKRDVSILIGTNTADGSGNITGYFVYHNQAPVAAADRDFAHCQLVTAGATDNQFGCIGTANSNFFGVINGPGAVTKNGFSVVGNQLLPSPQVGSDPPSQYNPNPFLLLQRQDVRYNAGFMAHIDVNDHVKPYLDFTYMDDKTTEVVGPSALFKNQYPFSADNYYRTNCTNPLLSAQEQSILCTPAMIAADTASPGTNPAGLAVLNIGRRNVEGGGRNSYYDHTNYRAVFGVKGDIVDGFTYDAYGQYYYTTLFEAQTNYLNYANIGQALLVKNTATGPACTVSVGNCVPYSLFTQGGVTAAQLAYLQSPGTGYGTDSEGTAHFDITGELGQYGITSPLAREGVAVNVGAEHRYDTYDFAPDATEAAGDLSGSNPYTALHAAQSVNEGFFDVRVPIAQDRPFIRDLVFDAAYRYSNYSVAGSASTYKFEVQYAPLPDFRLRYSYDRAVRAPNVFELYSLGAYGQSPILGVDPCAGAAPAASAAACAHTGVSPALYGNIPQCTSGQCGQVDEGNAVLKPEQADTYSIGITLTPTMLPNFTGSIDYWHIAQFGLIGAVPATVLLQNCLNTGAAFPCSAVVRNPVTGALTGASVGGGGYVVQQDINAGTGLTSGIDLQAAYKQSLGVFGSLLSSLNGSYLEHSVTTPYPGGQTYDCAGLFGSTCNNQSVNPRWRHNLRLSWETPWMKLLLSANWRFIGATHFDNNSPNPALHFAELGKYDVINARIPNYSYLDLAAVWPVWHDVQIRAGVNNVLDKDPPIVPTDITGTGSANSYPTFDILGREIFVSFTAKF